jgi:hypothetical protein
MLDAFHALFTEHGPLLPSADVQKWLTADPHSEWAHCRGRGSITMREIALLLDPFDIHPKVIHPKSDESVRGYEADEAFADAFARYLSKVMPQNCTTVRKK